MKFHVGHPGWNKGQCFAYPSTCAVCGEPVTLTSKTARYKARRRGYAYCPLPKECGTESRDGHLRPDLSERLRAQTDKTTTPDECWPWTGAINRKGYGRIKVNGRMRQVTHIILELEGFMIPAKGLHALHRCDNPPCCRYSHLEIGPPKKNSEDMVAKGRHAYGERQGRARLWQQDVDEIRALYRRSVRGHSSPALAKRFGVSHATILDIIHDKTWRDKGHRWECPRREPAP